MRNPIDGIIEWIEAPATVGITLHTKLGWKFQPLV